MQELFAILGLVVLCGAWVGFQRWLARVDPELGARGSCCGGCSGHHCETRQDADVL